MTRGDSTFAVIPFSPFVSSIGLLTQTGDSSRKSFICGSVLCLFVAIVTPLTRLFCAIPAGDQQRRDAGFFIFRCFIPVWYLASKSHLPHEIFIDWRSCCLSAFFDGAASGLFTRSSADYSAITEQWLGGDFTGSAYGKISFHGNALNNTMKRD